MFALPNIIFGINNDTAYVYAIQNKFLESNSLGKKINRLLFKINENFTDNTDSEIFNSRDVSMSFVAIVIIFISYLKQQDIKKIVVPVNLPIRYNSHYESCKRRLNYFSKIYTDEEFFSYKDKLKKQNEAYNDNTIMKLVRTFNRVSDAGDVLKVINYPFVTGSKMCLSVNKEGFFYNDFCNEIYGNDTRKK